MDKTLWVLNSNLTLSNNCIVSPTKHFRRCFVINPKIHQNIKQWRNEKKDSHSTSDTTGKKRLADAFKSITRSFDSFPRFLRQIYDRWNSCWFSSFHILWCHRLTETIHEETAISVIPHTNTLTIPRDFFTSFFL